MDMIEKMFSEVAKKVPLVHHLTNYVTVNDCANVVLACGGSPIMADDAKEVAAITAISDSLVLNIGTLNERTVASMLLAGKEANALGKPVVLDPVGAGASDLRNEAVSRLLEGVKFAVIRGNISEIKAVALGNGTTKGVDADLADQVSEANLAQVVDFAKRLSRDTQAVVAITGATDLITDGEVTYLVTNGHPMMSKITGSGCMLSSVIGAYVGANPREVLEATLAAVVLMGLSGERAYGAGIGTASFRMGLIDEVSLMDSETLVGGAKVARI